MFFSTAGGGAPRLVGYQQPASSKRSFPPSFEQPPPHLTVFADTKTSEQPSMPPHIDVTNAPKLTQRGKHAALEMERQIEDICCSLPRLVLPRGPLLPYNFTSTLVDLAEWLAPILGSLEPEHHAEFWKLFDGISSIWDVLPHIVNGEEGSGKEKSQMLAKAINSRLDGYQAGGTVGKVVLQGSRYQTPWSKNLAHEYHQELFDTLLARVSNPQWRLRDLETQRRKRVREHLEIIQMWRHFAELGDEPCTPADISCLNGSCTCIS
ncbi:hypothetical protein EST38_g12001 [Candolleomyces aberdarensis]|uniref:Uncharacterized protein n=1 Tax=Candolleomyces aberdarensis TaxID=2316362 RepID=A0A4Q2D642_9AGAR|nr:hypothetical protein EST38_g12001 [Candolleomyces aberdarensis]